MHPPALKLELKTNSSLRPISVYCQEIETDFGLPLQSPPAMTYNMTFTEYEARITKFQSLCRKWLVRKDLRPDSDEREEVELTEAVAPPTVFEADTESDDEQEYHICGETGGYNGAPCCHKKVLADDTCMIGNTSYCIACYEKYEEEDEEEEEEEEEEDPNELCYECMFKHPDDENLPECPCCETIRCQTCGECDCYIMWKQQTLPFNITVKELKAMCKARGHKKYSKLKRADILRLLFRMDCQ